MERKTLKNGLTLLLDRKPSQSLALSLLVKFGSNLESKRLNGIAHFTEHLMFNGPKGMSKKALTRRVDAVGGEINAFTSNELTVYYVKVLNKHFDVALKTMRDLFNPYFTVKEVEFEKKIILNEIRQAEDRPDHLIYDLLMAELYPGHDFGKPVIGTRETVAKTSTQDIKENFRRHYTPNNMLLAVSGNYSDQQLEKLEQVFGRLEKRKLVSKKLKPLPKSKLRQKTIIKEVAQAHWGLALKTMTSRDKSVYAMHVINTILGGGLSSRLMQEIREKRGLAYVVRSDFEAFKDHGYFTIYIGTPAEKTEKVKQLVFKEFKRLKEKKLSAKELEQAKKFIEGKMLLRMEDTLEACKNNLYLEFVGEKEAHEFLGKIFAVTTEDVLKTARQYFNGKYALVLIQPKTAISSSAFPKP